METVRLNALPDKRILRDEASKYTPDLALMELIDNSIDQWRQESSKPDLTVRIRFEGPVDSKLVYDDDAGGVPFDRLEALVKAGASKGDADAIGVWGMGVKVATLALAKSTTIWSRHGEGPTHRIPLPESWWATSRTAEDWYVDASIDPDANLNPGSVRMELRDLHRPMTDDDIRDPSGRGQNDLTSRLSRAYTRILAPPGGHGLHLHIVAPSGAAWEIPRAEFGDPQHYADVFAYPPGFEPTLHSRYFGKDRAIQVKALVGLLPEQRRDHSGVTFYGKGRLFTFALKEATVGFGTRGPAKIPASHPTTWRLVVLAEFQGDGRKIPWKSPAKWGYNENNPWASEIARFLREIAEPYSIFTRAAKRIDVLPYSRLWNSMDAAAKGREVEQFLRAAPNVRAPTPTPATFEPPSTIVEVDHERDQPVANLPSLSADKAREVARWLRRRGAQTPFLPWNGQALEELSPNDARPPLAPAPEDPWTSTFKTTVTLPVALRHVATETVVGSSMADFIRHLTEKYAARYEPLFRVEPPSWRSVLDRARGLVRDALPDAKGVLLFGSVAKGTADRESDIDLLVVHEDSRNAQRHLNDLFKEFRHPIPAGPRYSVHAEAITPAHLEAYAQAEPKGERKFRRLLAEGIWLDQKPDYTPPAVEAVA